MWAPIDLNTAKNKQVVSAPNQTARRLFGPIGSSYERWARVLSLGQDGRWRLAMVGGLGLRPGSKVLDVAAGTGSITKVLQTGGYDVTAVDLTPEMLLHHPGPHRVLSRAEQLPFADASFDGVTAGYLLRYVENPVNCLAELRRVLRSGGFIGMVEFGVPGGLLRIPWDLYSRQLLRLAGRALGRGWLEVGAFLAKSITDFHQAYDVEAVWRDAGLVGIRVKRMSFGSGLVIWARKP